MTQPRNEGQQRPENKPGADGGARQDDNKKQDDNKRADRQGMDEDEAGMNDGDRGGQQHQKVQQRQNDTTRRPQ